MKTTNALNPEQLFEDACSAISDHKYGDALHLLNCFLLTQPAHVDARLRKGLCYLYLNEAGKARTIFDQILDESDHHAGALACYAEYYKLMLDYETASHFISAALIADGDNALYHRMAAEIAYLRNDRDSAYGLINRAIVLSPFRDEFYFWRSLILFSFKKFHVALNDINRALALNPVNSDALRLRAKIRITNGIYDDAANDLKRARQYENRLAF